MNMGPRSNGRFLISLAGIAVLALLAWRTMEPGRYQQLTWLLLAFFAVRALFDWRRTR